MKILYLWDADYPWDIRVEKICKTLHTQGHEVHIACRNLNSLPSEELVDTITIHRLKAYKNWVCNLYRGRLFLPTGLFSIRASKGQCTVSQPQYMGHATASSFFLEQEGKCHPHTDRGHKILSRQIKQVI